ncbi:hypothetical protein ACFE04_029855 [Oxalis oulophora]
MAHNNNNNNQMLLFHYFFCTFLLIFTSLLLLSSSNTITSHARKHLVDAKTLRSHHPLIHYAKNGKPFFMNKQQAAVVVVLKKNKKKRVNMVFKTRPIKNVYYKTRPVFAMLPKGLVPPSGSSPCHNDNPNTVPFYCDFSVSKP